MTHHIEGETDADTIAGLVRERDAARVVAFRMARWEYPKWSESGGPVTCAHGIAKGIDCERCDVAAALTWNPAATPDGEEA